MANSWRKRRKTESSFGCFPALYNSNRQSARLLEEAITWLHCYPCWKTIKDGSECTFMSFLHLVWSIIQPEWLGQLEMHKNSFHEFHINNAYLNKICCNKFSCLFYGATFLPLCSAGEQFCVETTCWRKFIKNIIKAICGTFKNSLNIPIHPLLVSATPWMKRQTPWTGRMQGKETRGASCQLPAFQPRSTLDERDTYTYKLQLH